MQLGAIIVSTEPNMYVCYLCDVCCDSVEQLRVHLERHKFNGQLTFPIKCCQEQCSGVFTTVFNFLRHLKCYHVIGSSFVTRDKSVGGDEGVILQKSGNLCPCTYKRVILLCYFKKPVVAYKTRS